MPHLLELVVELSCIRLGQLLLPVLHAEIPGNHDGLQRVLGLHVFFSVAAAGPKCAPILPNWKHGAALCWVML